MFATMRRHAHVGCRGLDHGRMLAALCEAYSGWATSMIDIHMASRYSSTADVVTKRTNLCSAINDALHIVMENDPR